MATTARRYTGRALSNGGRGSTVFVPGEPAPVDLPAHRIEQGHLVDTTGRDEAPRGGGWMPLDAIQTPSPGLPSPASTDEDFPRNHGRNGGHDTDVPGGNSPKVSPILAFLRGYFPSRPGVDQDLETAGAAGAAHGGLRDRGMDPSQVSGRMCADGIYRDPPTNLGHTYTIPIERVRRPLHFNRPGLRRVLMPGITVERGGPSPGGYSSQYNPTALEWSAGPRQPTVRRLIKSFGQADTDTVSQSPGGVAAANPGPIGNGGW